MDLLAGSAERISAVSVAGAKASLRIFPIVTKPAKLLGETAHLIPNAVAIQRPHPPVLKNLHSASSTLHIRVH
jgi:hypothetical protein